MKASFHDQSRVDTDGDPLERVVTYAPWLRSGSVFYRGIPPLLQDIGREL
jgi:hypothetical protein